MESEYGQKEKERGEQKEYFSNKANVTTSAVIFSIR
jgi:hypothetical protein